jgi:cysteine desulfurase
MIYLDNNATTKPTPRVVEAMMPYLQECYFNASASIAVFSGADKPRRDAAIGMSELLNAEEPDCFFFTSGATESNNWVIFSVAKNNAGGRIIVSEIEHPSLAEPASELTSRGFDVVRLPVNQNGVVDLQALREALTKETILVSIMAANNETGVLQPLTEIGRMIREGSPAAIFHTDATQVVGKSAIDLQGDWEEVDMLSFSAHKFHGPKAIGGLYIRPGITLKPMLLGGGQEEGLRPGTTNTPGLAGLAIAAREAQLYPCESVATLRNEFERELCKNVPAVLIHGEEAPRLPNTSFFSLPGVLSSQAVDLLGAEGIYCATGSACSAGATQPSKTLLAMGIPYDVAKCAVRVSISKFTTRRELTELIRKLGQISNVGFAPERTHNEDKPTTAFAERHRM